MPLKIVQAGEPVLRQRSRVLTRAEIRSRPIQDLVEQMRQTMYAAPGVGLAAPQIGLGIQIAVIEDKAEYQKDFPAETLKERGRVPVPFHVIVNPEMTLQNGAPVEHFEGCLSVAGFTAIVTRAPEVTVDCLDHRGEPARITASGWHARILQHEIDHLNGTLYIDRMYTRSFMTVDLFRQFWKDEPLSDAIEAMNGRAKIEV